MPLQLNFHFPTRAFLCQKAQKCILKVSDPRDSVVYNYMNYEVQVYNTIRVISENLKVAAGEKFPRLGRNLHCLGEKSSTYGVE